MSDFRVQHTSPRRAFPRRFLAWIAAALSASAIIPCASAAELSGGVVKIGIINDQSGPLSDLAGPGSVVAARLAVEDFQRAEPSLKVEVIVADHQNKPDIGSQVVRRWIEVDGVDMIADVGNSAVALAIQSIARDKNKIVIYSAVGTTDIGGKQCSPTGVMWLHDNYNLVTSPIRKLVAQGYDSWFFIAADYAFGRNMVAESQRTLAETGGKSVGTVFHPLGTADYSSFLLQASASGAKVVAFANAGDQLVNAMKQWNEFGMNKGPQKAVAELMFLTDAHSMGPEIASGLTTITSWYWDLNDETRAFAQRFFKARKAMPTAPQAAVYSAVLHYLKAVAAAGTDDTKAVLEKMRSTPVDDFYARGATMRADNKLVHDFYLVEVKTPAEVKGPWQYYKVIEKIPGSEAYQPLSQSECPLINPGAGRK
jgi:branched-chain amino acid transport system substrate-binding protein